jgi:glycosyltransferase involved in cell wall biosynthesis
MPSFSIALATLNGESYLLPQLESIARQTRLPAELVVCDDGSHDRTLAIVEGFARRAPFPVRLHANPVRLGYRENFIRAAALCGGDLIAFCDQDDIWDADKLAAMEEPFRDPAVLLAYHNAIVIDDEERALGRLYRGTSGVRIFAPLALDPWNIINGFTQVFRRSLTRFTPLHGASLDPFWSGERLGHDHWYPFLASVFGTVVRLAVPLARYRQHGGNSLPWNNDHRLELGRAHILRPDSFIAAAANRCDLLRSMMAMPLSDTERTRLREAVAFYDALHRRLDDRMAMYRSRALPQRAHLFAALMRERAYDRARGAGRFGWKGLMMDGSLGVLLGPLAKQHLV